MKTLHLAIAAVLSSSQLAAQPGAIDLTFNPGSGVDSLVRSVIVQTGGKIIIGGDFVSVNGTPRKNIARLNSDGSLDNAFDPGAGFNDGVYAIALQPDGKILVGGGFSVFNGTPIKSLARLNANGTLDNSFGSSVDAGGSVYGIALQPDGKAIIGGSFSEYGGEVVGFIARVNSNGSLDNAFAANTGDGFNAGTWRIALQDDGKAVVVGAFNEFDGTPRERIIRLNNDGSLDASFDPGAGFSNWTLGLALQPDGKVLVGGLFTEFDNNSREFVARLNSDGSIDPSFDATTAVNWHVFNLLLQPDGKVIVIEWGYPLQLVRLNADGTKDPTFVTGSGFVGGGLDGGPASFALQATGRWPICLLQWNCQIGYRSHSNWFT